MNDQKNKFKFYKYVFIVLLYKNMEDIQTFIKSINEFFPDNSHIVLVNNFFSIETDDYAKTIAQKNNCSFISIENNGYGTGNNIGIRYALENFKFEYLTVCNPDTKIEQFDESVLKGKSVPAIYAPKIISRDHKLQNPHWAFHSSLLEYLQYLACKFELKIIDYSVIGILKAGRIITSGFADIKNKKLISIGSAHGSFFIASYSAVKVLSPFFDENMFLFYEEVYLGNKAYKKGIPIYYVKDIVVKHKEDGSMSIANVNTKNEAHKSVVYYYEHK